jgi:hypothetical protein
MVVLMGADFLFSLLADKMLRSAALAGKTGRAARITCTYSLPAMALNTGNQLRPGDFQEKGNE